MEKGLPINMFFLTFYDNFSPDYLLFFEVSQLCNLVLNCIPTFGTQIPEILFAKDILIEESTSHQRTNKIQKKPTNIKCRAFLIDTIIRLVF